MMLKLDILQRFMSDLDRCGNKSDFDHQFLRDYSVEILSNYSELIQWLSLYEARHLQLIHTEFDWTKRNLDVNKIWFVLGQQISSLYKIDCIRLVFPNIAIEEQDIQISRTMGLTELYYSDTNNRLMSVSRSISQNNGFSYIGNKLYPLTFSEAKQIRYKSGVVTFSNGSKSTRWEYILSMFNASSVESIQDLLYPLFTVVEDYFANIESESSLNRIHHSIQALYDNEIESLDFETASSFYAQQIEVPTSSSDSEDIKSCYLINILLDCLNADVMQGMLSQMKSLAVWIAQHQPSKLIDHADLQAEYQRIQRGVFCTRDYQKLAIETLLSASEYERELRHDAQVKKLLEDLLALLSNSDTEDSVIFQTIVSLYQSRSLHIKSTYATHRIFDQPIVGTYDYPYYRKGLNLKLIYILELFAGSGLLERYGIHDYFRILFPELKTDFDAISGLPLSKIPLSHCLIPDDDRSYLIVLDNSVENFKTNGAFENINARHARIFTVKEYKDIQFFSAKKFRRKAYQRIVEYPLPTLHMSTLNALIDLVNASLIFNGLHDNYQLQYVTTFPSDFQLNVIYLILNDHEIFYGVKDVWCVDSIHYGVVPIKKVHSEHSFLELQEESRLLYLLEHSSKMGHTRPNYSQDQYLTSCHAFTQFREFISQLDPVEKSNLNGIRMRIGNSVSTFSDIWSDGFPGCMSSASRWFSTIPVMYQPHFIYSQDIEAQAHRYYGDYLNISRQFARLRSQKPKINNDVSKAQDMQFSLGSSPVSVSSYWGHQFGLFKTTRALLGEVQLVLFSDKSIKGDSCA